MCLVYKENKVNKSEKQMNNTCLEKNMINKKIFAIIIDTIRGIS